ncbi:POM121-like protein 1-like [Plecturocebus cupreus]
MEWQGILGRNQPCVETTPRLSVSYRPHSYLVSGGGMSKQDKDPRVPDNADDQKGGPEGTRDAPAAFRPLRDNGGLSPFVPRPGPLQRDLHTQRSESPRSCWPKRNAISSSYSSTGGFPWLKRRKGPASSHCRLLLTSSKTVSEDSPQLVSWGQARHEKVADAAPGEKPAPRSGSPTSQASRPRGQEFPLLPRRQTVSEDSPQAVSRGQAWCEKVADAAPGEKPAPRSGSPASEASRPRRRKFPLLPRRQGEPLMLPPPLQLGFRVTTEDLDLEKKAALLSICSALQGLSSLAIGTSSLPAVPKAPNMEAQQERCKSQDSLGPMALLASAAGSASRCPVSRKKPRSSGPLFSFSDPHPATSAHSQDSARSMRSPRPGTSAAAAATATLSPSTWNPTAAPGAQGLSAPGLQVAASGASASAPASTSASLAPQAARDSQVTPMDIAGQQQGTQRLEAERAPQPSGPAASRAARASSAAASQPAQGTTAHSAAGVPLPTTSMASPAAKRKPASGASASVPASTSASLAPQAARDSQVTPMDIGGQQRGTRRLKRKSGCFRCSPGLICCCKPASPGHRSTLSRRGSLTHHFHREPRLQKRKPASGASASIPASTSASLAPQAARASQVTPMDIGGQQQGTRRLKRKWARQPSGPAASGAARASSAAASPPAQGTTAHSAAGFALPTTSMASPAAKRKLALAAGPAGTISGPSAASPHGVRPPSPWPVVPDKVRWLR